MKITRWVITGAALVVVIAIGTADAGERTEPSPSSEQSVRVAPVREAPPTRSVTLFGITRAVERGRQAFTSPGRLAARPVQVGDEVARGQVLARLDPAPFDNQVRSARARVSELEVRAQQLSRERVRLEVLSQRASASSIELERTHTEEEAVLSGLDAARAQLAEAERQRRESVLVAPWTGTVAAVLSEPGETLGAGQAVLLLSGGGGLEVEIEVPELVWARLGDSPTASVTLPAFEQTVPATLSSVGRSASPGGLFPVVVSLDEGDYVPGLTAEVSLEIPTRPALTVPVSAIVDPTGEQAAVFRVDGEVVQRVEVDTGDLHGDAVAVIGALTADDLVVVAGQGRLLSGDAVRVQP